MKQLIKYNNEKESSTHSKQEIFGELASRWMEEIQDLSKQIDFNNLTHKGNTASNTFLGFKGPLGFCKNVKEGYITVKKAEEDQK